MADHGIDEGQRVASLDEYAALARHLNGLYRSEQRTVAQDVRRRDGLAVAIAQLGQRIVAQHQRLAGLAQMIGQTMPVPPPGLPPAPVVHPDGAPSYHPPAQRSGPGATHSHSAPVYPGTTGLPDGPVPPPGTMPGSAPPGSGAGFSPLAASPVSGVPVAPTQRTGPELPTGTNRLALPATAGVPATGADPTSPAGPAGPPPPLGVPALAEPVDPARELDLARQAVEAADAAAFHAETAAQQAPLLPKLTPFQRAIFVYALCAVTLAVFQWILLVTSDIVSLDPFAYFAWTCAGLPTMAFFAGYLVLTMWGKPRIVVGVPARYARIGFLICFLSTPLAFCGYALTRL